MGKSIFSPIYLDGPGSMNENNCPCWLLHRNIQEKHDKKAEEPFHLTRGQIGDFDDKLKWVSGRFSCCRLERGSWGSGLWIFRPKMTFPPFPKVICFRSERRQWRKMLKTNAGSKGGVPKIERSKTWFLRGERHRRSKKMIAHRSYQCWITTTARPIVYYFIFSQGWEKSSSRDVFARLRTEKH